MAKTLTHRYDYTQFEDCFASIAVFEADAAEHLAGLQREDVGGVVLWTHADGDEQAWYDYEYYVGSVRALGGTRSFEV